MSARRRTRPCAAASVLGAAIMLAGCGGSGAASSSSPASHPPSPSSTAPIPTPATTAKAATSRHHRVRDAKLEVASSAVTQGVVTARYTCDGSNTSLPLRISGVPAGTTELMLDVLNLAPVNGRLFFDWAVTALSPKLHSIAAGKLPAGVLVGANSNGQTRYSLCPPVRGKSEKYIAVLFALPHRLPAKNGFNAKTLRLEALQNANYQGFTVFSYTRR